MFNDSVNQLKNLYNLRDINNIIPTEEFLSSISYKSARFNKSLKQLRVCDILIEDVLNDLAEFQKNINDSKEIDKYIPYRVKTRQSLILKYNKYLKSNGSFLTCFNGLLGFRVRVHKYPELNLFSDTFRVVDLRDGKKNDDGYRAIHLYYKKDNHHYPIEIQLWSDDDWDFNNWAHIHIYKYLPDEYGLKMKNLITSGKVNTEEEFVSSLEGLTDGRIL